MHLSWTPERRRITLEALCLLVLSAAFVAIALTLLHAHYTTNDDTGIIGFVVDGYPAPYVGIPLTSLLHRLYVTWPDVAWFGLCLYALLTLSLWIWTMLAWRLFQRPWLAAAAIAIIFAYYLDLLVSLDFTATSVMLCMSALASAFVQRLGRTRSPWMMLGPGLVFMLGWMVRPEAAMGACAYALPVALVVLIGQLRGRPLAPQLTGLARAALVFLLPVVLGAGIDMGWRAAVRTPQQAQYDAFNAAGGKFDHLNYARRLLAGADPAVLASVHWTPGDFQRFLHWKFLDERIYTPQALDALRAHAPGPRLSKPALIHHLRGTLPPRNKMFLLLAASLPLFAWLAWRARPEAAAGLALPAYSVALTVLMYSFYAFAYRVEMPFEMGLGVAGLLLGAALLAGDASPSRAAWAAACIGLVIAGVGAAHSARSVMALQRHDRVVAARVAGQLRMLNTQFAGDAMLMQPVSIGINVLSPLRPLHLRFRPINLGWNTFSPRFYAQIQAVGAQHGYDLIDAMVDNPKAYLFGSAGWARQLLGYAAAHPRDRIRVVRVAPGVQQLRSVAQDQVPAGR